MEERRDIKIHDTICNNHNEIIWALKQFKKSGDVWYVNQALKIARRCKTQGQRMEDRMLKYYRSIQNLGFQRIRKNGKKSIYD